MSEVSVPLSWSLIGITPPQPINVAAGSSCASNNVTVTNQYFPGCLKVHKNITGIAGVLGTIPDATFTVNVSGPSFSSPQVLTFHFSGGVITDNDQTLSPLIPGNYNVSEPGVPINWNLVGITPAQPINVAAGSNCTTNNVTVTNNYNPGCLEVTKAIDMKDMIGALADVEDTSFTINITGPSYPNGTDVVFDLTGGVLSGPDDGDTACLCNLIPGNYTAAEIAPAGWEAAVIVGSPATVEAGDTCDDGAPVITVTNTPMPGCLEVTKVVDLDDYMFAGSANSTFNITVTGPSYPTGTDLVFNLINGVLYGPDDGNTTCLCNLIPGNYTVAEVAPAGWDDAIIAPTQPVTVAAGTECDVDAVVVTVTNTLLIPHTSINITAYFYETTPGGNVWLYISDTNDGEVPLTDPSVFLTVGADPPIELVKGDAYWSVGPTGDPLTNWTINSSAPNGDTNDDGIMDVNETWYWAVQVTLYANTDITVNGHGIDPLGNPVDGPTYSSETDTITVHVGGATRTWGFWKTHLFLVEWMLNDSVNGLNLGILPIDLGTWNGQDMVINSTCRYMGLMWSDQAKNSNGTKREDIDAARIHTAHQALAAIMNSYMPGGAPLNITLGSIAETLTNGTAKEIRDLGSLLAAYNEKGEGVALDPSLPPTGKTSGNIADPQGGRVIGAPCESFWDTPAVMKITGKVRH